MNPALFLLLFNQQVDDRAAAIAAFRQSIEINSVDWTGVEERLAVDGNALAEVQAKIIELDHLVERAGLTNSEADRAKAITEALVKLISSPTPDWRSVTVALLSKPIELLVSKPVQAAVVAYTIVEAILKMVHG